MTISLAFLAPNLVKAAVEGRLPRGIGIERLNDAGLFELVPSWPPRLKAPPGTGICGPETEGQIGSI